MVLCFILNKLVAESRGLATRPKGGNCGSAEIFKDRVKKTFFINVNKIN